MEQRPPVKLEYAEAPVEKPVTAFQVVGVILFYVGVLVCIVGYLYWLISNMP